MEFNHIWVERNKDIKALINDERKIYIKWSKKANKDYIKLSRNYFKAGYKTLQEIIEVKHNDNIKYDMWFCLVYIC